MHRPPPSPTRFEVVRVGVSSGEERLSELDYLKFPGVYPGGFYSGRGSLSVVTVHALRRREKRHVAGQL